jgi:hypothetical protein
LTAGATDSLRLSGLGRQVPYVVLVCIGTVSH